MEENKNSLHTIIKNLLSENKSKEEIYLDLLAKKYTIEQIEQKYNELQINKLPTESVNTHKTLNQQEINKAGEDATHKTINLILTIGSVLIAAGVFSFIAANWSGMDKAVKVGIILFFMIAFYIAGFYMMTKTIYIKSGKALINTAAIIYGAGIFLIAQIYNIQVSWYNGYLVWMLGVSILAFAIKSNWLHSFSQAIVIIGMVFWFFQTLIVSAFGSFWGPSTFRGTSLITLALLLIVSIYSVYCGIWLKNKTLDNDK